MIIKQNFTKTCIIFLTLFFVTQLFATSETINIPNLKSLVNKNILSKTSIPIYDEACVFTDFSALSKPETALDYPMQLRMFHDNKYLYFAALCRVAPGKPFVYASKHDGAVWNDDSFELFIAPDASKKEKYLQFIFNSKGVVYDASHGVGIAPDVKWNASDLKINVIAKNRDWILLGRISFKDLGIKALVEDKQIAINIARNINTNQKRSIFSWAPVLKSSLRNPELFIQATLSSDTKGAKQVYSNSDNPELCVDGDFELGQSRRFYNRFNVGNSLYYAYYGRRAILLDLGAKGKKKAHANCIVQVKPDTQYAVSAYVIAKPLECPNMSIMKMQFFDKSGQVIKTITGPGIGNLGGGGTRRIHKFYFFKFKTPAKFAKAELIIIAKDHGSTRIDGITVKKYNPVALMPKLISPVANIILRKPEVPFVWELFDGYSIPNDTYTLSLSQDKEFPADKTLLFKGVMINRHLRSQWLETVPRQGKWFWKVKFNGKLGVWSKTASFTVAYNARNEQIKPSITDLKPRGRVKNKPTEIKVSYFDPGIASGIDLSSIKLSLNGKNVTSAAQIKEKGLTYKLLKSDTDFFEVEVTVKDKNDNTQIFSDFIYVSPKDAKIGIDAKGFICRDGERYFLISYYAQMNLNTFSVLEEKGFNNIFSPWYGVYGRNFLALKRLLGEAQRNNLTVVAYCSDHELYKRGKAEEDSLDVKRIREKIKHGLKQLKGHPALLGIASGDEDFDTGAIMKRKIKSYKWLKKSLGDNHIVCYLPSWGHGNPDVWKQGAKACDMVGIDDYGRHKGDQLGPLSAYRKVCEYTGDKPFYIYLEGYVPTGKLEKGMKMPNLKELRFQMYSALVTKARGMTVYTASKTKNHFFDGTDDVFLKDLFALSAELKTLTPFLIANDAPEAMEAKTTEGSVQCLFKRLKDELLVIVVNSYEGESKVELSLQKGEIVNILDVFSSKNIPKQNQILKIKLPKYSVKIYKLRLKG